jgi:membrane-associated HD superfamily phosphohydrolase
MEKQMSVGDWMVTYLLTCIPLVGFIMLFVWGFSSDTQPSKKTWAQATLIFMAVMTVLYLILGAVFMAAIMGSM